MLSGLLQGWPLWTVRTGRRMQTWTHLSRTESLWETLHKRRSLMIADDLQTASWRECECTALSDLQRHTDRQTDSQTDSRTDRHRDGLKQMDTDRQKHTQTHTDRHTDSHTDRLTHRPMDRQTHKQTDTQQTNQLQCYRRRQTAVSKTILAH